jgi:fatty-acyl-CoA synthase
MNPMDLAEYNGAIGLPISSTLACVKDDSGQVLPAGDVGELCIKGPQVMAGYWQRPEETAKVIDADGWLHTGDLCAMDARGYCTVEGRLKDMIIRGGENIYPREIEEFLFSHPAVADVQVIGVPDAKYGEEIAVWVILHSGQACGAEELRAYCKANIAHFKVPRYFKFVDQFPMTVTGKVQKFRMRELMLAELEQASS